MATVQPHETARDQTRQKLVHALGSVVLYALLCCDFSVAAEKVLQPVKLGGVRREPVAAAKDFDQPCVAIACAKSGTLLFWNVEQRRAEAEFKFGDELRGVKSIGLKQYLVLDSKRNELIQVEYADRQLKELQRYPLPLHPVAMCHWQSEGEIWVAIAALWSRQISIWRTTVELKNEAWDRIGQFTQIKVVDVPFEPKLISYVAPHVVDPHLHTRLQVADAFGGGMAEIDLRKWTVRSWHQPIHNIGSLEFDGGFGSFYVTHQTLQSRLPVTVASIRSGELLQNRLSYIPYGKQWAPWQLLKYQIIGRRLSDSAPQVALPDLELTADPAGVTGICGGRIVCLAGTNEVAVFTANDEFVQRLPVGKRPRTAIYLNYRQSIVLGELDDTITLIDGTDADKEVDHRRVEDYRKITAKTYLLDPASAQRELGPAERGERLFFDARMSAGGRMSCHSCHPDGHTNGLLADTLGDNTHGTPKRVLTLRGTRLTDLWAWNGEMKTLQDNVHKSLQETMHAPHIKPADVDDLVSFLHTLPPVPPLKPVPQDEADRATVTRGEQIFLREGCATCHVPPLTFTSHAVYDVGLADEKGLKKFNPPSLRGVGRLRKLFHDNRANGLREVFETHGHQLAAPLPAAELDDLIRYLESL